MTICVIPARGNSKRIPGKNLLSFNGKPLVRLAAELAVASKGFDKVIVSSEDPVIFSALKDVEGIILSPRPEDLSEDHIRADEIVRWEISKLPDDPDRVICCLFPTTPLLTAEVLLKAENLYSDGVLFGVVPNSESPYRSFRIASEDFKLCALFPEMLNGQSQDYPLTVVDAGQFYFAKTKIWQEYESITAYPQVQGFLLDPELAIDINNPKDWQRILESEKG